MVRLDFQDGLANAGALAGAVTVAAYAQGEGPLLMPGPWGDCLDLRAASRMGGTLEDKEPAGGAVFFSDPAIDALNDFTVLLWVQVEPGVSGISARILTKFGSWELMWVRGYVSFAAVEGTNKPAYRFPRATARQGDAWTFLAVTVSQSDSIVRVASGDEAGRLFEPVEHKMVLAPSHVRSGLEIGSFRGIRPFKGRIDGLRLYGDALSHEQVAAVLAGDTRRRTRPPLVYTSGVVPAPARRFGFKRSDIIFSSRWQRRRWAETLDLLRAYHATHLLWVYGADPEPVQQVRDMGIFYQGTVNGLTGYQQSTPDPRAEGDQAGRQWNLDGNKFMHRHMEKWKMKNPRWVGCHVSPDFRKLYLDVADALVKIGVDGIHVDGWEMGVASSDQGRGCFCPACMEAFRAYLKEHVSAEQLRDLGIRGLEGFDYAQFLKQSCGVANAMECRRRAPDLPLWDHFRFMQRAGLRDFYATVRRHLDERSPGRYLPVSVNNQFFRRGAGGTLRGYYCVDVVDFFVGEATQSMQTAAHYVHCGKLAEGFGIPQVMMCKPHETAAGQAALATCYALGCWMRVPWDLYMDNDAAGQPAPRYYGKLEDWQRYYEFVQRHPGLFDGYESTATLGLLVNADEECWKPVWQACQSLIDAQVQFRVIVAAARYSRTPLCRDALESVRHLLVLSPIETFCAEDRAVIDAVRDSRRVRFLAAEHDAAAALRSAGQALTEVEGPRGIHTFLRVKPQAAVVHLVNWNPLPDGNTSDPFQHVTVRLLRPERWGSELRVKYYSPGQEGPLDVQPEIHRDYVRLTAPRLDTWGVLEILPAKP